MASAGLEWPSLGRNSFVRVTQAVVLAAAVCAAAVAQAGDAETLEEVLASASRIAPVDQRVVLLTEEDLEADALLLGVDALRSLPGFALSTSGGRGALAQARVRGAEANHLLVLLDGVALNDPASGSEFDFASLALAGIGQLEFLSGPQSAVWGSDALAGVLHLSTTPREARRSLSLGTGTQGAAKVGAEFAAVGERGYAALHVQHSASDGENAALEGDEADGFSNTTAQLSAARRFGGFELESSARWTRAWADYDPSPPPRYVPADGDRRGESRARLLKASVRFLGSPRFSPWLTLASVSTRRRDLSDGEWQSAVSARRDTATFASNVLLDRQRFNATVELKSERFEQAAPATIFGDPNQRQRTTAVGLAGEYQLDLPRLALAASVRRDFNDEFDDAFAYRVGVTSLGQPRWFGSVGRGVKNPTFVERFGYAPDAFVGNPQLQPETATGFEAGVEWRFDAGSLTLLAFDSALRGEIDGFFFDVERGAFTARNLAGRSRRRGAELVLAAATERSTIRASYAYVDAADGDGNRALRRPRHLADLAVRVRLASRLRAGFGVTHNGRSDDNDYSTFPANRATLPSFRIVRAHVDFDMTPRVGLRLAVDNMLDAAYSTVFGYASPGIAALASVRFEF